MSRRNPSPSTALAVAAACLCFTCGVASAAVTLSLPTLESNAGQSVDVPIAIKGAKGVSAMQALLTYDPAVLEVVTDAQDPDRTMTRGDVLPDNAILKLFTETPGRLPLLFLGGANANDKAIHAITGDGTLATVHFKVKGAGGQKTALALEKIEAFQVNDMDLLARAEPGALTVRIEIPWLWIGVAGGVLLLLLLIMTLRRRPTRAAG
ncbi:MAG: hypothetical protein GC159_08635 [Phycisphaera sp.]|nr:hypothetical protein [Phycisphaera sp.]